jgi:dihydrofolate reductase
MLTYIAIASLDLYAADENGKFDWAMPSKEVHAFVNDLERPFGTHMYGRRLYNVMTAWETIESDEPEMHDFAELWRAADKIVYSTTLRKVTTARTTLERRFDPEVVSRFKAERDVSIGGPTLAAQAFRAGLIDECHLLLSPVIVGGGLPALPLGVRAQLELLSQRRFENGVVHLHYRTS